MYFEKLVNNEREQMKISSENTSLVKTFHWELQKSLVYPKIAYRM